MTPQAKIQPVLLWGLAAGWMGCLVCLATLLLIQYVDVESVMVTGPIIMVLGMLVAYLGSSGRYWQLTVLGLAHCGVCLLFFGLVVILRWTPSDAKVPFTLMGLVYGTASLIWVVWITANVPRRADPWACASCGYLLYGLVEPRCPECGQPFDPAGVPIDSAEAVDSRSTDQSL